MVYIAETKGANRGLAVLVPTIEYCGSGGQGTVPQSAAGNARIEGGYMKETAALLEKDSQRVSCTTWETRRTPDRSIVERWFGREISVVASSTLKKKVKQPSVM